MKTTADPGKGFAAPIFDAQSVFRLLLDALARPGTVQDVGGLGLTPQAGLSVGAMAVLLCLADHATPVWLKGGKEHPASYWLSFHTGAAAVEKPGAARFALLDENEAEPPISAFAAGEPLYPDRSASLLFCCRDFVSGAEVELAGPGIKDSIGIAPSGLRRNFWDEARANAERFPLGVDIFLIAGGKILGLPRTTRIAIPAEAG